MKKSKHEITLFVVCGFLIAMIVAAPIADTHFLKWRTERDKAAVKAAIRAENEKELSEMTFEPMIKGPLIGREEATPTSPFLYIVEFGLSNFWLEPLRVNWVIKKGQKEFVNRKNSRHSWGPSNVTTSAGNSPFRYLIGHIRLQRKETIVVHFNWKCGKKFGVKRFVITPQQKMH